MIHIENLSKAYYRGKLEIPALRNVTCKIGKSEVFSVIGKSGSGKSTLLNLIGGLDKPTSGHIYFNGKDMMSMSRQELAYHRRYSVGMIFQSFNLIHSRNALENIALALAFGGVTGRKRKDRAGELLEMVGLADRVYHKPDELSGGEAQRVAIARAMANNPSVILADEPTGNLDSSTSEEIVNLLRMLNRNKGITLVMVTHEQEMAGRISDCIIRLADGRIIDYQTKTKVSEI